MEILAAFNCLSTLGLAALFTILLLKARNNIHKLRERLQALEQTVHDCRPPAVDAAPVAQSTTAKSATSKPLVDTQPVDTQSAAQPLPTPRPVGRLAERLNKPTRIAPAASLVPAAFAPERTQSTPKARALSPLLSWFTHMHIMVQIGVIVLFFGVGFLVQYAVVQGWFPLEARLISAAGLGVVLAAVGWAVRGRRREFGLALQGGGIGIIYLTTFGAFALYGLIGAPLAFAIFVILGSALAALAVLNNARILALLAIVGAFLAPVLAPSGGGSHVALFSYFAVVNAAILAIAWFKAWRSLNLVGFFFTVGLSTWWGLTRYEPQMFASVEGFLWLFFGFYLAIAVLYARRRAVEAGPARAIDLTLIFGNAIAAFSLQFLLTEARGDWTLLGRTVDPLALTALAVGLLYVAVFAGLRGTRARLAGECFLFLGTLFLALAVPFAFGAQLTAALWAVQGALYVVVSVRRSSGWMQAWGILVQTGAAAFFTGALLDGTLGQQPPLVNDLFVGSALIALAALASGYMLHRQLRAEAGTKQETTPGKLWTAWGLLWWFGTGLWQITAAPLDGYTATTAILFLALSGVLGEWLGRRTRWAILRAPLHLLLPVLPLLALWQTVDAAQPLAGGGWYAWPLALAAHLWLLHRRDRSFSVPTPLQSRWTALQHAGTLWLIAALVSWEAIWLTQRLAGDWVRLFAVSSGWFYAALLLVPTLLLVILLTAGRRIGWPLARHWQSYRGLGAGGLALWLLAAATVANVASAGDSAPFSYLPLLNPLDLAQIAAFGALALWLARVVQPGGVRRALGWLLFAAGFFAFNALLARGVHQTTGASFTLDSLYSSALLQTLYAITWSALALLLMFWANRRALRLDFARSLWTAGALLLGTTVLKLFVVDLANADTVARIVSFIGVGLLIIAIAYFAPAPKRDEVPGGGVEPVEQMAVK